MQQGGLPLAQRARQTRRVAERGTADNLVQPQRRTVPAGASGLVRASAMPKISTSSPLSASALPSRATPAQTPAARRDAWR